MDQMIDHSTIERTSGLRQRRPASRTWIVGTAAALALLLVYLGSAYYRSGRAIAPQAAVPSVTVSKPLQRDVDTRLGFLGQFSAIDRVELRAQVGGTLTEIHFQDGQIVHKGDLLFVIDPRPYEIKLAEASQNTSPSSSLLRSVSGYGLMSPRPGQVSRSANPLALSNRRRPSSAVRLL
jgi:membrane fusion protein, multidrug efflux system